MTSTTSETSETNTATYEKGSWQATIDRSAKMAEKGTEYKKKAGILLWQGAQSAIEVWTDEADNDPNAEGLASELLGIMGNSRKGDVSKIKTVALATRNNGLRLDDFPNLSKAYAEARRLTQTVKEEKAQDASLAKAIETIAAQAQSISTPTTPEEATLIVLAKGEDEAARLIGDALGNDDARRAFLRAVAQDVAGRVKAVAQAKKADEDKARAEKKAEADKAKAEKAKATPAKTAKVKPASEKGKPAAKATPAKAKAKPVPAKPKAAASA